MKILILSFSFFIIFSCEKKEVDSYYEIISVNDSISKIIWGNSTFSNAQSFNKKFLDRSYIRTGGKNENFIVIYRAFEKSENIGLILPLKKKLKIIFVNNIIKFDGENNLLISGTSLENKLLFLIKNLNNNKKMIVGKDLPFCKNQINLNNCYSLAVGCEPKKFCVRWYVNGEYVKYSYDVSNLLE